MPSVREWKGICVLPIISQQSHFKELPDRRSFLLALSFLATTPSVYAGFLNVDFQNSTTAVPGVTQTGFNSFTEVDGANPTGKTFSTTQGNINLQVSGEDTAVGGFFTRSTNLLTNSGSFTYADLYNDFIFKNSTTNQINFVFSGLAQNQQYQVTFFSYDNSTAMADGPTSHDITFTGIDGSTGTSAVSYTSGVPPLTNAQYAVTAQFTTDGTGTLRSHRLTLLFRGSTGSNSTLSPSRSLHPW